MFETKPKKEKNEKRKRKKEKPKKKQNEKNRWLRAYYMWAGPLRRLLSVSPAI